MPLPPSIISASAIVCERVLKETDGVMSAIRIVDIFFVPEPPPIISEETPLPIIRAFVLVNIKAKPRYSAEHFIQIKVLTVDGQENEIGQLTQKFSVNHVAEDAPVGASIVLELNLAVKKLGTCYVSVYLDESQVMIVPITLQRRVVAESDQKN